MSFHLVQPWGRDTYHQATVISTHKTLHAAYAELDRIAEKLQRDGAAGGYLEIHVVDEERQPVPRPGMPRGSPVTVCCARPDPEGAESA